MWNFPVRTSEITYNKPFWDFPSGPVAKNLPSHAGNTSSIPGQGTKIPTCHGATKPMHHNKELAEPKYKRKKILLTPKERALAQNNPYFYFKGENPKDQSFNSFKRKLPGHSLSDNKLF